MILPCDLVLETFQMPSPMQATDSKTTITRTGEDPMEFTNPSTNASQHTRLSKHFKEFFKSLGKTARLSWVELK